MIRLKTLGSLDLRAAEGAALQPVLRQSKRLALLAYLAIERPGQFHRRDQLLGLFWPEADLRGGRASLSQAVHFLRQYLGKDAIINRGDEEIGVATDRVWCDAVAFQQHCAAGEFAEAMALYAGDLLPSFFVEQADGFEQWLEQKRDTLQREAMRACVGLADAADTAGRDDDVVTWLRRAIGYVPYDESLHRRLIVALDRAGDRAAALRAYEALEQTLGEEFEAEPSAETQEVIAAVRARTEAQSLPSPLRTERAAALAGFAAPPVRRRRQYLTAVMVAIVTVAAVAWGAWTARLQEEEAPVNRIAVLFFEDESPNRELGYLADGLTSTLIGHLGQVRRIQVISQNGVRPFRGDSIPLDSIARQLDVGTIVGGTVSRSGDQLRVKVELVKGATGIIASTKTFNRPTGELFALLDDVAAEVGSFLRLSVGEEIKLQRYRSETESVAAWQAVQKAEKIFAEAKNAGDRGDRNVTNALFAQTDSLLSRAAQLDRSWAEPLVVRARMHETRAWLALLGGAGGPQPHLASALAAADEALARDERSAAAYETRGRVRYVQWLMLAPPQAESARLLRASEDDLARALAIDADRARAESTLSMLYESQARFADARRAALRALDADAYLEDADQIVVRLFQASFELEDDDEAGHWCDEIRRRLPGKWPSAYCDLLLLGWRDDGSADARKALYILETFGARDRAELRNAMRPRLTILAATTIARSGDTARAEQMVRAARAAAPHDRELAQFEAGYRVSMKEFNRGRQLLAEYFERNPNVRARLENGRMFRPLREAIITRAATSQTATDRR